jgi:formylmethanofuran dehydrogenase subunit E
MTHVNAITAIREATVTRLPDSATAQDAHPLAACLDRLAQLHPQLCPRQVLGARIGLAAGEALGLDLPQHAKRLLVLVETNGCFADGVAVATGCWLGRRTLRLVDYGRVAATAVDTVTGVAVRIWPHPLARARALEWAPAATDRWHAQLASYQVMPMSDLLRVETVKLTVSLGQLLGRTGVHVTCVVCGEEIVNGRELVGTRGVVCRACAVGAYYCRADAGVMPVPAGGAISDGHPVTHHAARDLPDEAV